MTNAKPHLLAKPGEEGAEEIADASDIFEPPPPGTPPPADHLLDYDSANPNLQTVSSQSSISLPEKSTRSGVHMVAVDHSPLSEEAFDWACRTLSKDGDEIVLVHVVKDDGYVKMLNEDYEKGTHNLENLLEQMGTEIRNTFRRRLELFPVKNIHLSVHVKLSDSPKTTICELASELAVDTLVLGSHGASPLKHLLLGSTSAYCMRHAAMPVVIVRHKTTAPAQLDKDHHAKHRWSLLGRHRDGWARKAEGHGDLPPAVE
ncbi:hypothetical protein SpCBS45565_g04641 [Spizellomyces sp. 'palustris']|nr:hypothetical protein SpCBS45565_g04641 [Spizellomyces sp. 'palustris']